MSKKVGLTNFHKERKKSCKCISLCRGHKGNVTAFTSNLLQLKVKEVKSCNLRKSFILWFPKKKYKSRVQSV